MSQRLFLSLLLLLGLGLAAVGVATYRQHGQQVRLATQLQALDDVLQVENKYASRVNKNTLAALRVKVARAQNPPAGVRQLDTARAFETRAQALLARLAERRAALLKAQEEAPFIQHLTDPDAAAVVAGQLGPAAVARPELARQLRNFTASQRRLHSTGSPPGLLLPATARLPLPAALAALTRLQSQVLLAESQVFKHINSQVVTNQLESRLLAVATADRAVVAPGDTYRARLFLVQSFIGLNPRMYCNGQPIPIGPDGAGQVRFRAPTRPGPAAWTGTVRLNYNGRDTTFQTLVEYRVARR